VTLKEISKYYELRQRLTRYNEALLALRTAAENITSQLDGIPPSGKPTDKVAHYGGLIAQLEADIERNNKELREAKETVLRYIRQIDDMYLQTIFLLRFIECLSWDDIALSMGKKEAADSIRMACYRRLDKEE
jgi:DNA-directed RNA polymerase specialized sigma24 family protein